MTDTAQTPAATTTPVLPIHKSLWAEVTALLGRLPWRISNQLHTAAEAATTAAPADSSHVGVSPDLFNATVNLLADQPAALVKDTLNKVTTFVTEITTAAQGEVKKVEEAAKTAVSDVTAEVAATPAPAAVDTVAAVAEAVVAETTPAA